MNKNNYIYEEHVLVGYHYKEIKNLYNKLYEKLAISYKNTGINFVSLHNAYKEDDGIYVCYEHWSNDLRGQTFIKRVLLKLVSEIIDEEISRNMRKLG